MPLPDDPIPGLLAAVRARLTGVTVAGERPADLAERWLPCLVLARVGGLEALTNQGPIGDRPLLSADCYAAGLPAARGLAQDARRVLLDLGAATESGPLPTPDAQEADGVRRITFTVTYLAR